MWGWGYGGEGQLGLGSRTRIVTVPNPVPFVELTAYVKDRPSAPTKVSTNAEGHVCRDVGRYVKAIACGGRHSAVITDTGAVVTFGWGLYGQLCRYSRKDGDKAKV